MTRKFQPMSDEPEIELPAEQVILADSDADSLVYPKVKKKKKSKLKASGKNPAARSTETLFRNAVRSNLDLTQIADNKANIMISVNGFILTVIVTAGGFAISNNQDLLYPFICILITAVASIGCAVMAVKPKVDWTRDSIDDLKKDKSSVLYFKHFIQMNPDDYVSEMKRVLSDVDTIHTHLARHIYGLGYGLTVKFRWLRFSYTVFTVGLTISALVFVLVIGGSRLF